MKVRASKKRRSTFSWVRASIICANISPNKNDSVKFLEPTTTRSECDREHDGSSKARATKTKTQIFDLEVFIGAADASPAIPRQNRPAAPGAPQEWLRT